jgi:hypothetical protein
VLLIALIVGLHFRSIVAPLVTLAAAGVAYMVTIPVLVWLGQQTKVAVPQEIEPLVVVLLLGIVTDYTIFFLSGMRTRLAEGRPAVQAAKAATGELARIILTAGMVVAAATAALVVTSLSFFRALGPGPRHHGCDRPRGVDHVRSRGHGHVRPGAVLAVRATEGRSRTGHRSSSRSHLAARARPRPGGAGCGGAGGRRGRRRTAGARGHAGAGAAA